MSFLQAALNKMLKDEKLQKLGKLAVYVLLAKASLGALKMLTQLFPINLTKRYGENSWAVIAGASDEIGTEFCKELAKRNFNLVLIAKNQDKLEQTVRELLKIKPIKTRIITVDFRNALQEDFFQRINNQLKDLDISILVNNVNAGDINKAGRMLTEHMITVNTIPAVLLTRTLINKLASRNNDGKRSAVITVSSYAALRPMSSFPSFSAASAYCDFFSRGLGIEYRSKVDFISLRLPCDQVRKIRGKSDESDDNIANKSVKNCLKSLGTQSYTNGTLGNLISNWHLFLLPDFLCSLWEEPQDQSVQKDNNRFENSMNK